MRVHTCASRARNCNTADSFDKLKIFMTTEKTGALIKNHLSFLADRNGYYGRAYGTMFCPSVVCLSVTFCIVAKRYFC